MVCVLGVSPGEFIEDNQMLEKVAELASERNPKQKSANK